MSKVLLVKRDGDVISLTLNRPEKRNALSHELLEELEGAIEKIAVDSSTRAVVIASTGPVFCSGHDLAEMAGQTEEVYLELFDLCTRVMLGLRKLAQPVIARVQGVATAAGCQLVAACDLAVAAEEATFATPGVKIGLFCTTPMVPFVRSVPAKPALEMLFTGAPITARRAVGAWARESGRPRRRSRCDDQGLHRHDHRHEPPGHPDRQGCLLRDRGARRAGGL